MAWFGTSYMGHKICRMDSEQIKSIPSTFMVPTIGEVVNKLPSSAGSKNIFQQVNNSKHMSKLTKKYLATERM